MGATICDQSHITDNYNYGDLITNNFDALRELIHHENEKKNEGINSPNICVSYYGRKTFMNIPCETVDNSYQCTDIIYKYTTPSVCFYSDMVCNIESNHVIYILVNNCQVYKTTDFKWTLHDMFHQSIQILFFSQKKDIREFNIIYTNKVFSPPYRSYSWYSLSKIRNDKVIHINTKNIMNSLSNIPLTKYSPNLYHQDHVNNIKHHLKNELTVLPEDPCHNTVIISKKKD